MVTHWADAAAEMDGDSLSIVRTAAVGELWCTVLVTSSVTFVFYVTLATTASKEIDGLRRRLNSLFIDLFGIKKICAKK
jgi:hypothetical protein